MTGPLDGVAVVELGGIGPTPYCGMLLADLGADVLVLSRAARRPHPVHDRGKRFVEVDLKSPDDLERVREAVGTSDAVIEGFRPGVAERLGIGPTDLAALNPALVYGRITGFGRTGPFADRAGHDINYISLSGALGAIGPEGGAPVPPLNLVADFGGGGMLLALGVTAALLHARVTGEGRVVDAAMIDGSASLMGMMYGFRAQGRWNDERGTNLLDGGAPFYGTYLCADGGYVAVGALEAPFYAALLHGLDLAGTIDAADQNDRATWPSQRDAFASAFAAQPREHWERVFGDVDACVTPVLGLDEAPRHPHNVARGAFVDIPDGFAPASAPRFSALVAP